MISYRKEFRTAALLLWGSFGADVTLRLATAGRRGLPLELSATVLIGACASTLGWAGSVYAEHLDNRLQDAMDAREASGMEAALQLSLDVASGDAVRKPQQTRAASVTSLREYPQTS